MQTRESLVSNYFGPSHANSYDERAAKFGPVRDALSFLMRTVLLGLPDDSRILCVGVGTGSELLYLAESFPGWQFTAVEPSAAMLEVCVKKADEAGISSRCEFHKGYLESLPPARSFDAATSILVSQFLTDWDQRRDFFKQITMRLSPGGYLINADLASSGNSLSFENMFKVWGQIHGLAATKMNSSQMGWGEDVAVSKPQEIESLIASVGFENPICFYQALFIHAWYARLK